MRPKLLTLLFVTSFGITAQNSLNISLKGQTTYLNDLSDIWGYTDSSGNEFALVGTRAGVSIVDVSNASSPIKKQFIQGPYTDWRDLKTWSHYAYIIHDNTSAWNTIPDQGLLIVDLDSVNNTIPTFKTMNPGIQLPNGGVDTLRRAHNLYIDENGYAYLFGANVGNGGALIFDVATDPWNPTYIGMFDTHYLHDGMVRGDTLWAAAVNIGKFLVIDATVKDSTVILATHGTPNAFTHNAWISDDNTVLFTTDEIGNAFLTAYDVSDLANITELDRIQTSLGTSVIPHNAHVYGQWVVTSYYTAGVQIVDAKYPELLVEVGYFDTSPSFSGNGFYGNWGAYPYFESGLIVCSDIEEGLSVLEPTYVEASRVHVVVYDSITRAPLSNAVILFDRTSDTLQSSIDGLADAGTHLDVMDSISVKLAGFVTHRSAYQWQAGVFDTVKVALLNVNNVGTQDVANSAVVLQPNPNNGIFQLTGVENGTYQLIDSKGSMLEQGVLLNDWVELKNNYAHGSYYLRVQWETQAKTFPVMLLP
ncbi:MAG: choice-of-anchor B family protein [Cryomorphaceae bacterium]|nr:choice-of-anchor B family protein [Cryomorphaceae bacterium]MBL6681775.1 choice-of-anchor B family protein [Cryomorphaceae bacterium]MBL6867322.1 choice-of-anchor B family protein [Cryomorphaceae bacterium]